MSTNTEEKKLPTKDEIIAWYNEQIEIANLRFQLADLNAKIAKADEERLKSTIIMAQMQGPQNPQQQGTPHVVTQEDLDSNPELVENNVKVGDTILVANKPQDVNDINVNDEEVVSPENPDLKIV